MTILIKWLYYSINDDYSDGLVGQINQNKKSAQLEFDLIDDGVGSEFKKIIDECARTYLKHGWGQDVIDAFERFGQFIVMLVIIIHYTIMVVELNKDFL